MKRFAILVVAVAGLSAGWLALSAQNARSFGMLSLDASHNFQVSVNGQRVEGSVPFDLRLPPGRHEVRVSCAELRRSKIVRVRIEPGKTVYSFVSFHDDDDRPVREDAPRLESDTLVTHMAFRASGTVSR